MKWISVKDRIPTKEECEKDGGWFLVKQSYMQRACMDRYDGHLPEDERNYMHNWKYPYGESITHWQPLPELPKD